MQKNSDKTHDFSMADVMRLANSDAGKQLFALLQSTQGTQLRNAMELASAGNLDGVRQSIQSLMASPEAQGLLKKMQEDQNG